MLSCKALISEQVFLSPFTKRRSCEGAVIYQLRLSGDEPFDKITKALIPLEPFGIDINLGCPAPEIKRSGGGCALFDNREKLVKVLEIMRKLWPGTLSVKCRLGLGKPGWEEVLLDRLRIFENSGIDVLTVHPRFIDEKLKRKARWEYFEWIQKQTSIPLIANGDICTPDDARQILGSGVCSAIMLGRITAVKPWIFRAITDNYITTDFKEPWVRFFDYVCEDFPPEKAIGRIKEFSSYYSRNFFFGHEFFRRIQSSQDLPTLKERGLEFLNSDPVIAR